MSVIIYILFLIIYIIGQYNLIKRCNVKKFKKIKQLPDLFLDMLPYCPSLIKYMDFLMILFVIPLFFQNIYDNFLLLFKFLCIICLLRSITTNLTLIPNLKNRYSYKRSNPYDLRNYFFGHNCDKIFSGHISIILIIILITISKKLIPNFLILFLIFFKLIYILLILLSKQHYSIDIFLSYIITIPIYCVLYKII